MKKRDYKLMMKQIGKYTDFTFLRKNGRWKKTPSSAEKAKITKYHNFLFGKSGPGILHQPHKIYRPRNIKRKQSVIKQLQIPRGLSELKALPIPALKNQQIKLKFDSKNNLIEFATVSKNVKSILVPFDIKALAKSPIIEIQRILNSNPKFNRWSPVTVHKIDFGGTFDNVNIISHVIELMNQYSWDEFLYGLKGFVFKNQKAKSGYIKSKVTDRQERARHIRKLKKDLKNEKSNSIKRETKKLSKKLAGKKKKRTNKNQRK